MAITHHQHIRVTMPEWEDLRFPAHAINPLGGASDPARDLDDGTLVFEAGEDNRIAGIAQLPHGYKEGTSLYPHLHYGPIVASGGMAVWELNYQWVNRNGQFTSTWTSSSIYINVSTSPNVNSMQNFYSSGIDGSGKAISSIFRWKIRRDGTNTSDNAPDLKLWEFDIHYQVDSLGSDNGIGKT